MRTIQYSIRHFIFQVSTPEEIDIHKLQSQIPGIERSIHQTPHLEFVFIENNLCQITQDKNKFTLSGIWGDVLKSDIPHLFYAILKQYWIENEYYAVHSVMLGDSLLLGHSGAGKTSISLEAMKHQMNISSYDKTLVHFSNQQINYISGTDIISVRKEFYENNSSLFNDFKNPIYHGDRILFISQSKPVKIIKNIYLFFLAQTPLAIKKLTMSSSLHELYPYFMDTVKTDVILNHGQAIFSGNNSSKSKLALVNHLKAWLQSGTVEVLVGTKEDIVQYVNDKSKKDK